MNKAELVASVALRANCTHIEARAAIDLVLGAIADGLIADGVVSAFPLGTLNVTYSGGAPYGVGFMPSNAVMANVRGMTGRKP